MILPAHYQSLELLRVSDLVRQMQSRRDTPLRILDFGCGKGKYLALFREAGCSATACDSNPDYAASARSQGFPTLAPEDVAHAPGGMFDVVFLSHVIEHLAPSTLTTTIPALCRLMKDDGRLIIITPVPGDRFYHDATHVRPYLPQSIRHAFGQEGAPVSLGERLLIEMVDVYFFRDPFRTRFWRTFYVGATWQRAIVRSIDALSDAAWRSSGGRIGRTASWLGIYHLIRGDNPTSTS